MAALGQALHPLFADLTLDIGNSVTEAASCLISALPLLGRALAAASS
jgi:hypothetical protein